MAAANELIVEGAPTQAGASADVVVIGAGACGLVAALRAVEAGAEVLVLERDASPSGSTSMSSGFVPAPGTRFQRAAGVSDDTPKRFEADLQAKSKQRSVPHLARLAASIIGEAVEWLDDNASMEWHVLDDFLYPGHSRHRMHAVPEKTGAALHARLFSAVVARDIPVLTEARAKRLCVEGDRVVAVEIERPDGSVETVRCGALVLACNGYGGNPELVSRHIPEMREGLYFGHAGNTGDALLWGEELGAKLEHLTAYQGHGSLATPQNILISWALMTKGGFQVATTGRRFSNESGGYSEQAVNVLSQPGGVAWNIFDAEIHEFARSFPDYCEAEAAGAVRTGGDVAELAAKIGVPVDALEATFAEIEACRTEGRLDAFGRDWKDLPSLKAPYHAVKVTGALFHTQGGLVIDEMARVLSADGAPFPNLFAGGGAACGVSGPDVSGYLSGNGLLTAIAFGYIGGREAAKASKPA